MKLPKAGTVERSSEESPLLLSVLMDVMFSSLLMF